LRTWIQFVFTDDGILQEMENVHVDKDGNTAKPTLTGHEIQQWASKAYDECSTDESSYEITYTEVRETYISSVQ